MVYQLLLALTLLLVACSQPTPNPTITSAQAPVISRFGASPASGTAPLLVRFFWSISDTNRDLMSCELDVAYNGDTFTPDYSVGLPRTRTSNCTSSSRINHTFAVGTHTVALRVCDGANCTIRTQVITANPNPNNRPPLLSNFAASPNPVGASLPTTFSWSVSDPNLDPLTCTFDPDTATSGNESTVPCNQPYNYSYAASGDFTAQLSVSDNQSAPVVRQTLVLVRPNISFMGTGTGLTCAILDSGPTYCWGFNPNGELGNGTLNNTTTPTAVSSPQGVLFSTIEASVYYTCALSTLGKAYCWGNNPVGMLGNGTTQNATTPQAVTMDSNLTFSQLSVGGAHNCALTALGQAYCWGYNVYGELGNGSMGIGQYATTPQPVPASQSLGFSQITTGFAHTCALTNLGKAYCWGYNSFGQVGNGSDSSVSSPVEVSGSHTFTQIAAGDYFTCALNQAGQAYCWGLNDSGQLGTGTSTPTNTPVQVTTSHLPNAPVFTQIYVMGAHACALTQDSQAYCWGNNSKGQLGNGSTSSSGIPQPAAGNLKWQYLVGSAYHTCGITVGGLAYCWGGNDFGQLANPNNNPVLTPMLLPAP